MLYGTNSLSWSDLNNGTYGVNAVRAYSRDLTPPSPAQNHGGAITIASVKCADLAGVIEGRHDHDLTHVITGLPPRSLLTLNHEGNGDHHGFSPLEWRRALLALHKLAHDQRPGILVGAIFTTWPVTHSAQNLAAWVEPGLDWFGLDGYQETRDDSPASVFAAAVEAVHYNAAGPVMITETNSAVRVDSWAVDTHVLAVQLGMVGYLHFADLATPYRDLPHAMVRQDIATQCAIDGIFT